MRAIPFLTVIYLILAFDELIEHLILTKKH